MGQDFFSKTRLQGHHLRLSSLEYEIFLPAPDLLFRFLLTSSLKANSRSKFPPPARPFQGPLGFSRRPSLFQTLTLLAIYSSTAPLSFSFLVNCTPCFGLVIFFFAAAFLLLDSLPFCPRTGDDDPFGCSVLAHFFALTND